MVNRQCLFIIQAGKAQKINPLKDCLTIQVSEKDVKSPDFNLYNFLNKEYFDKAQRRIDNERRQLTLF